MNFTHADGDEHLHLIGFGGDGGGELKRLLDDDVAAWKEDVVVAALVGGENDLAAVLIAASQILVEDSQIAAVLIAKSAEPSDFGSIQIGGAGVDSFGKIHEIFGFEVRGEIEFTQSSDHGSRAANAEFLRRFQIGWVGNG